MKNSVSPHTRSKNRSKSNRTLRSQKKGTQKSKSSSRKDKSGQNQVHPQHTKDSKNALNFGDFSAELQRYQTTGSCEEDDNDVNDRD